MKNIEFTMILITVSLSGSYGVTGPGEVTGKLGGSITVRCQYSIPSNRDFEKYWCKGAQRFSCTVMAGTRRLQQEEFNRMSIVDNQTSGVFSVTMEQLSLNDAGWYWCGIAKVGKDEMASVKLNVPEGGLTGPKEVYGTLGGAVTVACQYHVPYYKNYEKYLCKGTEKKSCSVIAGTQKQNVNDSRRIIVADNQISGVFSVTISKLLMEDAGRYWCGITITGYDKMVPVQLNISEPLTTSTQPNELQKTITWRNESTTNLSIILVPLLGVLIVLILVATIFVTRCRKQTTAGKKGLTHTEEESNPVYNATFFRDDGQDITYDMATSKFSTQIQEDFPTYIYEKPHHEQSAQGEFTHQKLSTAMELIALLILTSAPGSYQLTGPKKVDGEVGGSVTVDCRYDLIYKDHVKQWCKGQTYFFSRPVVVSTDHPEHGRVSLTDNKTQGIFSVTMNHLLKSDEGLYWCVIARSTFQMNERISIKLEVSETPARKSTMGPTTRTARTTEASVATSLTTSFHSTGTVSKEAVTRWQVVLSAVVVIIVFLLLVAAVILCAKTKQQKNSGTNEQNITDAENPAVICKFSKEDNEVTYSTVKIRPRADREDTYVNVQDLKAQETYRSPSGQDASETVKYSTILLKA
ncbi:polymeric immunoglobulin receptor-like [Heptranchias perlo]|uniref:polymeric immunoglobulin receptor-like n=1 Tax=Heptranchias perlo TaxID=212740 RepID=UPI00355999E2